MAGGNVHFSFSSDDKDKLVDYYQGVVEAGMKPTAMMEQQGADWFEAWHHTLRQARWASVIFTENYKRKVRTSATQQGLSAPLLREAKAIMDLKQSGKINVYVLDPSWQSMGSLLASLKQEAPSWGQVSQWEAFIAEMLASAPRQPPPRPASIPQGPVLPKQLFVLKMKNNDEDLYGNNSMWGGVAVRNACTNTTGDRRNLIASEVRRGVYVITLENNMQMYSTPDGWVGFALQGTCTNQDKARREWTVSDAGQGYVGLSLANGQQLYVNPSHWLGVSQQNANTNTEKGRREFKIELA